MPYAVDQEGPAPPQLFMSSSSVVALCFAMPGGRASPAEFTAVAAAAPPPFALDQEGPASSELCASSGSVTALHFAIPRRRWSWRLLRAKRAPLHQRTPLSWYCTVRSQEDELHQQFSQPLQRGDRRSARQFAAGFLMRHDLCHFLQLCHHLRHAVPEEVAVALKGQGLFQACRRHAARDSIKHLG